jgi:hypothetical protein
MAETEMFSPETETRLRTLDSETETLGSDTETEMLARPVGISRRLETETSKTESASLRVGKDIEFHRPEIFGILRNLPTLSVKCR